MIVADTSALLAFYNRREPAHEAVTAFVDGVDDTIVVSPYVIAELDYLLRDTRIGGDAATIVLDQLASGAYSLECFEREDLESAANVIRRYADQRIGIADASLVVLAHRHRTRTILTLDHRHFDVLRPIAGGRFKVVP